ncbi:MAG: type II secretion system F family protein [Bacteroidota bacterium]
MEIKDIPNIQANTRKTPLITRITEYMNKDIQLGSTKISDSIKHHFYHELSMLLGAGLDIKKSLETIVDEQKKEKHKDIFQAITTAVIHGKSLHSALQGSGYFSAHEYYTIQIGEETGTLAKVLEQLYTYYDKKITQKRQVVGALMYPAIVLGVAILAVLFFMTFLIPMFMDIFARFDADLPALTQFIVSVSDFLSHNLLYICISFSIIGGIFYINRKNQKLQLILANILLHIPYCKTLIQLIQLSKFTQVLSLLIASNIPLSRSLFLIKQMTSFLHFKNIIEQIENDVLHGELLYEAMQKHSFFPKRMIYLVRTGEEVNKLEAIFSQLHSQYSNELEHKTSLMSSVLEPLLIIFVGIIVAIILIAMYLPMFQLGTTIY